MFQFTEADSGRLVDAVLADMRSTRAASALRLPAGAWQRITDAVNDGSAPPLRRKQLQDRLSYLRNRYRIYQALHADGRFNCAGSGAPTASDDVWTAYLQEHPEARGYRESPLAKYKELHEIFSRETQSSEAQEEESDAASDATVSDGGGNRSRSESSTSDVGVAAPKAVPQKAVAAAAGGSSPPRKRQRSTEDESEIVTALNRVSAALQRPYKTQVQLAIADFLATFRRRYKRPDRLSYVQFLTAHPEQAETYNVLDAETKEDFVKAFFTQDTSFIRPMNTSDI
ncbi:hypothetical protein BBJ28_00007375 [Nothophytophthora sp. Chile5]|nr:hypothetical protein BBJ28_00007375 [Nothophytophthora sp. Chile5]